MIFEPDSWRAVVALCVASFLVCTLVLQLRLRFAAHGLAAPCQRSLHEHPTPHGGGLGILVAILGCGWWIGIPAWWLACLTGLALLSLVDDWRPLPFWLRLPAHLAAAGVTTWQLSASSDVSGLVLLGMTLAIAWSANAFNFMDGADGLAGSMALIGFSAYTFAFFTTSDMGLGAWSAAVCAASMAFLRVNWHPAKVFMGDVGSIPLGYLAGALGAYGVLAGAWELWFALLVFAPFFADASFTLMRRAFTGKKIWQAHREHLYQRMVAAGYGHRGMCQRWVIAMLVSATLALFLLHSDASLTLAWVVTLTWFLVLAGLGRYALVSSPASIAKTSPLQEAQSSPQPSSLAAEDNPPR